jgi:hypothetical protein
MKHVVVMLPTGDWSVLPHLGKLKIVVVDDSAIETLQKGADIKDIEVEAKFGLHVSSVDANLVISLIKENE